MPPKKKKTVTIPPVTRTRRVASRGDSVDTSPESPRTRSAMKQLSTPTSTSSKRPELSSTSSTRRKSPRFNPSFDEESNVDNATPKEAAKRGLTKAFEEAKEPPNTSNVAAQKVDDSDDEGSASAADDTHDDEVLFHQEDPILLPATKSTDDDELDPSKAEVAAESAAKAIVIQVETNPEVEEKANEDIAKDDSLILPRAKTDDKDEEEEGFTTVDDSGKAQYEKETGDQVFPGAEAAAVVAVAAAAAVAAASKTIKDKANVPKLSSEPKDAEKEYNASAELPVVSKPAPNSDQEDEYPVIASPSYPGYDHDEPWPTFPLPHYDELNNAPAGLPLVSEPAPNSDEEDEYPVIASPSYPGYDHEEPWPTFSIPHYDQLTPKLQEWAALLEIETEGVFLKDFLVQTVLIERPRPPANPKSGPSFDDYPYKPKIGKGKKLVGNPTRAIRKIVFNPAPDPGNLGEEIATLVKLVPEPGSDAPFDSYKDFEGFIDGENPYLGNHSDQIYPAIGTGTTQQFASDHTYVLTTGLMDYYHYYDQSQVSLYRTAESNFFHIFWGDDNNDLYNWFTLRPNNDRLFGLFSRLWECSHPPSYHLWMDKELTTNPTRFNRNFFVKDYMAHLAVYNKIPHSFNIFSKRLISLSVMDRDDNTISIFGLNLGAVFTRNSKHGISQIFYADSHWGNASKKRNQTEPRQVTYYRFVLEVVYMIEVFIRDHLRTGDETDFPQPNAGNILMKARHRIQQGTGVFSLIPAIPLSTFTPLISEIGNSPAIAALNTRCLFLADSQWKIDWSIIKDAKTLAEATFAKFWAIPLGSHYTIDNKDVLERIECFNVSLQILIHTDIRWDVCENRFQSDDYLRELVKRARKQADKPAPPPNDHGTVSLDFPDDYVAEKEEQKGVKDKTSVGQFFANVRDSPKKAMEKSAQDRIAREESMKERRSKPPEKHQIRNPDRFLTENDKKMKEGYAVYARKRSGNKGDAKKAIALMEEWFPVSDTTGETEDKEVLQISKLKYIPLRHGVAQPDRKVVVRELVGQYYQGLAIQNIPNKPSKSTVIDRLNPDWIHQVFESTFVRFVVQNALRQSRLHAVAQKTAKVRTIVDIPDKDIKWIDVPAGNVLLQPVTTDLIRRDVTMKYRQGKKATCIFSSFASLLAYKGHKDAGNRIQQKAILYVGLPLDQQLDGLERCVRDFDPGLKSLQRRVRGRGLQDWDPLDLERETSKNLEEAMLVVLLGADGGTQHAVAIVDDLVFDSNLPNALTLTRRALDWCCGGKGGYVGLSKAIKFWF